MQIFFRTPRGSIATKQLPQNFTYIDFIKAAGDAIGVNSKEETISWRYVVNTKPINIKNAEEFNQSKKYIIAECNILVLGRLLGGFTIPEMLQNIAEDQLKNEITKINTQVNDCIICLNENQDCIHMCCIYVCKECFKNWILNEGFFKLSCSICKKKIILKNIFKTPEYIATLQTLEDEEKLLKNINCQRCFECNTLMCNETMHARQKCITCCRIFCFFCNRNWKTTMKNNINTCGDGCTYESMLHFELIDFHYDKTIKIPSHRTCPKCFNYGVYDNKCKYHTCASCKFCFCFLCLESEQICKDKYKSSYNRKCVITPIKQTYDIFPLLSLQ